MKKIKKILIFCAVLIVFLAALSYALYLSSGRTAPFSAIVLADLYALLIVSLPLMIVGLIRNLRRTVYSYENVGYIGGIFFVSTLLIALFVNFVTEKDAGNLTRLESAFHALTEFPKRFSFWAVAVMFAVCIVLGVSNIALIRHEGFRPGNLLSILLGAFYIGGTVAIYFVSDLISKTLGSLFVSRGITVLNTYIPMFLLLLMCYLECILLGCAIMSFAATRITPKYDKDYIIILGCSIDRKGGLRPLLKGRANRAVRFAWDQEIASGKSCKYVPSGGQGPDEVMSEGSALELYLLSHGAEEDEVFPEKKSRNTYENMLFSKAVIDSLKPDAKIAFATTNFHVFRSGLLARAAGFDAEGVSSPTKWYFWPNGFIREFFALLAMKKRAHISVAAALAASCTALGMIAYFGGLI